MNEVLFITPTLGVGGSQQHMISFANYLQTSGYKVIIINITSVNDLAYRLHNDVELINIPKAYNFDLSPSLKIKKIVLNRGIKTIFCDSLFTYLFVYNVSKLPGIKISVIFHSTNYVDNYNYFKDLAVRLILRKSVQIIGICKNQINRLSKVLLIPNKRFELIYNGIDVNSYNYQERIILRTNSKLREELQIPSDAFVIIKTARFSTEKNHELAVEVLEKVRNKHGIDAYMILVGNTNNIRMEMISKMGESKGIGNYIKIVGMKKDVKPYLAISDVFILTSKAVETFSIAALEAMAMGLPAVLSNLGGAEEMVIDGKNGYVVPNLDVELFADSLFNIYKNLLTFNNIAISKFIVDNFNVKDTNKNLTRFIIGEN